MSKKIEKLKIDFPNWKDLSVESTKFYLSESEKRLDESIKSIQNIKNRAYDVLKIIFPLLTISVGFVFFDDNNWDKLPPVLLFLICQTISVLCILFVVLPRTIQVKGALPSSLIIPSHATSENQELQYIGIVLNYCENLDYRIKFNMNKNKYDSWFLFASIVISGFIAPLLFILALFN